MCGLVKKIIISEGQQWAKRLKDYKGKAVIILTIADIL